MSRSPSGHLAYRPDIDGLRAVAIIAVVLFHAGISGFRNGYIGVDIFFVISGYLISGIICSEQAQGPFSVARFYERRIRRIIPALFVMMVFVAGGSLLWLFPYDLKQNGRAMLSAATFTSNFEFWRQADYFGPAAQYKPLLHTWSLAIEEQFYVFYPPVLMLLRRYRPAWIIAILATGTLLSSALCIYTTRLHPTAAFFLTPTRAWELLMGCTVAFLPAPAFFPRWILELSAVLGMALIAYCLVVPIRPFDYPGSTALFPCLGAVLLVYFNSAIPTAAGRVLGLKPLVFVGLISYSLYLWHWPILTFSRVLTLRDPTAVQSFFLVGLSFLAAVASWRWVERPFRRRGGVFSSRASLFAAAGAAAMITAAAASSAVAFDGWPGRFSPAVVALSRFDDYSDSVEWRKLTGPQGCEIPEEAGTPADSCFAVTRGKRNLLLWGDSHAEHLSEPLTLLAAEHGGHILQIARSQCLPATTIADFDGAACEQFAARVLARLSHVQLDGVILSAEWLRPGGNAARAEVIAAISQTVSALRGRGLRVLVIGPSPRYSAPLSQILARYQVSNRLPVFAPRNFLEKDNFLWDDQMKRKFDSIPGVTYVSLMDALCRNGDCQAVARAGIPMEWDSNHFTREGAALIFEKQLKAPVLKMFQVHGGQ